MNIRTVKISDTSCSEKLTKDTPGFHGRKFYQNFTSAILLLCRKHDRIIRTTDGILVNLVEFIGIPAVFRLISPCLPFSLSSCLPVSLSPCLHVSMSLFQCLQVSGIPQIETEQTENELTENCNFRLFSANKKMENGKANTNY